MVERMHRNKIDTRLLDLNVYCPQLVHARGPEKVGYYNIIYCSRLELYKTSYLWRLVSRNKYLYECIEC